MRTVVRIDNVLSTSTRKDMSDERVKEPKE